MARGRKPKLSPADRFEVRRQREAGIAIARIAGMWGISTTTVQQILADLRLKFGPEQLPHNMRQRARHHLFTSAKSQAA